MRVSVLEAVRALCPNPLLPKRVDPDRLEWGFRLNKVDFSSSNGFVWPFLGRWARAAGPFSKSRDACPSHVGDGLCVARTIHGAQSRGAQFLHHVGLLVAWLPNDVLGANSDKVRVRRAWVGAIFDPLKLVGPSVDLTDVDLRSADLYNADLCRACLRWADLRRANLSGANLRYVDLRWASLDDANLSGANLRCVDLRGANLSGANLSGADLSGALADEGILWSDGFDPEKSGVILIKSSWP